MDLVEELAVVVTEEAEAEAAVEELAEMLLFFESVLRVIGNENRKD